MPTSATSSPLPIIKDEKQLRKLGALCVDRKEGRMALPLAAVDIKAQVVSRVASVTLKQTFNNPYTDFLEAVYIFPLSGGVAVSKFEMKVGDRTIHGKVDEREQARLQYTQAIESGKRAALMEQEREDVFTVSVGNLPPGEQVEITIVYSERLPYFHDGKTEIRLPLVIGHRYIPGTPVSEQPVGHGTAEDTDIVPDASRITPPRLVPGVKADLSLSIQVEVATDQEEVSDLSCSQHATSTAIKNGWISVALSREDEVMDRDFVLTWRLATSQIFSRLYVFKNPHDASQSYGMLNVLPPKVEGFVGSARDVVFVVDRSGSMRGIKMSSAIRACSILLETLAPRDRFAVVAFDDTLEWLGGGQGKFYDADEDGLERGHKFLRTIDARGGTELSGAMDGALKTIAQRSDTGVRAPIVVVLTDGEVGDESRVLKEIQNNLGDTRLFTIGIDTAVNSGLLKRLAAVGGGTAAFVQPGVQLETALINIGREIGVPLVTDLQLETSNKKIKLQDFAPNPVPDLFVGRAVTVFFRLPANNGDVEITIKGKNHDGTMFAETVACASTTTEAIAQLWAKAFVNQLEDDFRAGGRDLQKLKQQIVTIAKTHSLLTRFTAFVLVDESEVVNKDASRRTIVQPVAEPSLWEMNAGQASAGTVSPYRMLSAPAPMAMPQQNSPWSQAVSRAAPAAPGMPSMQSQPSPVSQKAEDALQSSKFDVAAPSANASGVSKPAKIGGWDGLAESISKKMKQSSPPGGGGGKGNASNDSVQFISGDIGSSQRLANQPVASGGKPLAQRVLDLYRALEAVWSLVKAGQACTNNDLAQARELLLKELANCDIASDLPELQRFVRVDVQELIAALSSPGTTASDLQKLCSRTEQAFNKVKTELQSKLRVDATTGSATNFWESNI